MEMYYCPNCVGRVKKDESVCPHCGFAIEGGEWLTSALKKDTILNGRYLVGRVMGQGGFGITYVGLDLKLELKVAIKEYFPGDFAGRDSTHSNSLSWSYSPQEQNSWEQGVERFLNEARKMAKLDELNGIVRVRDSFKENETAYIVMDFAEGVTLKKYLEEHGPMDYRTTVEMLLPIIDSLQVMHEKGMVHRDISPDNLMVRENGKVLEAKLLDFGAAAEVAFGRAAADGNVVKRGYSAPEQYLEDGKVGSWTDVYAMAAVIYKCVSGNQIPEAMERVMGQSKLTLDGIKNKKAQTVLANALSLQSEERTQTMAQLKEELEKTLPRKGVSPKVIAGVAAAVVVCTVGAVLGVTKPWIPSVSEVGITNSNLSSGAGGIQSAGYDYIYYLDKNWDLYVCAYNEEDEIYYVGDGDILACESASYINEAGGKVYFIDDTEEEDEPEAIMCMDGDGSNLEVLVEGNVNYEFLQYVELSNGKRYLYYVQDNGGDDDLCFRLCRYDIDSGESEEVLDEDIYWYNVDGKYLYYTSFTSDSLFIERETEFKRAYLDGTKATVINDTDCLYTGYVVDGKAYMYSYSQQKVVVCSLKGEPIESDQEKLADVAAAIYGGVSTYANGWIYYTCSTEASEDASDTLELYRIRTDGTDQEMIYSCSDSFVHMCYGGSELWVMTGTSDSDAKSGVDVSRTYLLYPDSDDVASTIIYLGANQTSDGLVYEDAGDGKVTVTGYDGDEDYVVITWDIDGCEWDGNYTGIPEGVTVYIEMHESELVYSDAENYGGYVITAYTGEVTGDCEYLALPGYIGDTQVSEVGEKFMTENTQIKGLYVPKKTMKLIGTSAFRSCINLETVILSEGLEVIMGTAFHDTAVTTVELPASLESFYYGAFTAIDEITVADGSRYLSVEDGALYAEDEDGRYLKLVETTVTGTFEIPSDVVSAASYTFYGSQVSSVIIPASFTDLSGYTFYNATLLESVTFEGSIETIGVGAFAYCLSLKEFTIPDGVTTIGDYAFYHCEALESVAIPNSVEIIDDCAFGNCALTKVSIPLLCELGEGVFDEGVEISYK